LGREVVDVEGEDQFGVGGDGGSEDVPVLLVVGHRLLEALDLGGIDFGFLEGCAHRLLDAGGLLGGDLPPDEVAAEPLAAVPSARNVRVVIRYRGSATIQQGKLVIGGECVVESGGDQLAEPDLPWSGRFHDPAPAASLGEGRAWLRLNEDPVREGAIKITRAGAGLIDFDGIGSLRELR
jgi:hypothetical protein